MADVEGLLRELTAVSAKLDSLPPKDRDAVFARLAQRQPASAASIDDATVHYNETAVRHCPTCGAALPETKHNLRDILLARLPETPEVG